MPSAVSKWALGVIGIGTAGLESSARVASLSISFRLRLRLETSDNNHRKKKTKLGRKKQYYEPRATLG